MQLREHHLAQEGAIRDPKTSWWQKKRRNEELMWDAQAAYEKNKEFEEEFAKDTKYKHTDRYEQKIMGQDYKEYLKFFPASFEGGGGAIYDVTTTGGRKSICEKVGESRKGA